MAAPEHLRPCVGDARKASESINTVLDAAEVLVYGSVARGCAMPGSDVDLMVVFDDLGDYT